jgi:hypothetical protein
MPQKVDLCANRIRDRGNIFSFALKTVGFGIPALASPTTVNGIHSKLLR